MTSNPQPFAVFSVQLSQQRGQSRYFEDAHGPSIHSLTIVLRTQAQMTTKCHSKFRCVLGTQPATPWYKSHRQRNQTTLWTSGTHRSPHADSRSSLLRPRCRNHGGNCAECNSERPLVRCRINSTSPVRFLGTIWRNRLVQRSLTVSDE